MYQTNSPPKLVTSKTFFPLTWSSPPKSITPLEEWHSILKFLPLFDTTIKRHKKPKDMIGDRQKTDIERTRRTRNHRTTRKRETRCYGHKDKRKMQNMWKTMHARGSRSIERCREAIEQTSMDRTVIEKLSRGQELSRSIHLAIEKCRDCDEKQLKSSTDKPGVERCRGGVVIA